MQTNGPFCKQNSNQPAADHKTKQQPAADHKTKQQPAADHKTKQQPAADHKTKQQPAADHGLVMLLPRKHCYNYVLFIFVFSKGLRAYSIFIILYCT